MRPEPVTQAARATGFTDCRCRCRPTWQPASPTCPPHHRDPFDRLLVAQAMDEAVRLYIADPLLPPYFELVTLVG